MANKMNRNEHRQRAADFPWKTAVWEQLVTKYARGLANRHGGFRPHEFEDLRQELFLAVMRSREKFNPDRASVATFLDRLLRNRCASLIRAQQMPKRDWRRNGPSLQQPLRGRSAAEPIDSSLIDAFDERQVRSTTHRKQRTDEELAALQQDLNTVLASLPDDLRALAELLKDFPLSVAAEKLGESRRQVREKFDRLREVFEDHDLDRYL